METAREEPLAKPAEDPGEPPAPRWTRVVAALPDFFLALQFLVVAVAGASLFATPEWLTAVMQVELLVIHSMGVFGALMFFRPASAWGALGRLAVMCALIVLYLYTAYTWGFDRVMVFVCAAFATYCGLFLNWRSRAALGQLGMRWIVCMIVYWVTVNVFDLPPEVKDWAVVPAVLGAGALYFLTLGAIELSGFYQRTMLRAGFRMSLRAGKRRADNGRRIDKSVKR